MSMGIIGLYQRYCLYRRTNDWRRHEKPHSKSVQEYYSSCTPQFQTRIPPSSRALHLTKRTCLRTFNTIRSWLYWLVHSPVLPSLITKSCFHWLDRLLLILPSLAGSSFDLTFTGWIVFWSYLHWLDRLLIFPSLARSSSTDLIFTGWIVFWSYLHWLDRLLILPSLTGSSSSDLTFTGWIVFFWSYFHWLDYHVILPLLGRLLILSLLVGSSWLVGWSCLYWLHFFLILILLITIQVLWTSLKWDMVFLHLH